VTGEYRLSERAAQDIADIYAYSLSHWGEDRADEYVESIYRALKKLAAHPGRNTSRHKRSTPFRMIAVRQHFALYEILNDEIIVLALMHQAQDIEKRVTKLTPVFRRLLAQLTKRS
jgi:plasmid stabilization system protein ParE